MSEMRSPGSRFLTPEVCAVSAFTLAVVALLGQNIVTVGVAALTDSLIDDIFSSTQPYYLQFGLATVAQVLVAALLALRALATPERWVDVLARAALVLSAVALVAGVLAIIGAWGA